MEEVKNCKICGRLFQPRGIYEKCPICIDRDEKDFLKIREYLYHHPLAKIFEVSTNLDISIIKIKRFLREGRMEIREKNNQFLKCEICGKSICSGQYCEECRKSNIPEIKSYYIGGGEQKKKPSQIKYKASNLFKARSVV